MGFYLGADEDNASDILRIGSQRPKISSGRYISTKAPPAMIFINRHAFFLRKNSFIIRRKAKAGRINLLDRLSLAMVEEISAHSSFAMENAGEHGNALLCKDIRQIPA